MLKPILSLNSVNLTFIVCSKEHFLEFQLFSSFFYTFHTTEISKTLTVSNNIKNYSKTCVKRPLSKRPKIGFKTNYCLMQVKSIAECSKGSILQYFRASFSYHLSLRSLFCLFLSGRFTQVLLYIVDMHEHESYLYIVLENFILFYHDS